MVDLLVSAEYSFREYGKSHGRQKPVQAQRTVLVTGGARGIGLGTAMLLESRGYRVALADLHRGQATTAFFRCDVSREPSVRACVRAVLRRFGRLDALINNAGIADPADPPVEKLSLQAWNRRIGVNLTGVFLMTKHCTPHLRKTRGAIVNIASTRALQSESNTEAYAASKGGVVALTHALAMSLGPRVRVNCISPGWIAKSKLSRKDHAQHPAGRAGRPEDVGELIAYLISDAAGFITGQNFVLDGGMTRKMIYV
jgi:NAD(P)-dependent dehydrogenase (short-subunit alcohol dehydrogenase family)